MLHFLINPAASGGKAEKIFCEAEKKLIEAGVPYDAFRSAKKGDIAARAAELTAAGEKELVAVGGDGTLNEAVRGIADPDGVTLGLIPAGTGNDFAVAAGIPEGVAALELILHTEPKYTDYLECGVTRSINIAGMGIDVDILERCERKKGGAKSKYYRSLLASLVKFKAMKMEITADGKTETQDALLAAVCNGTTFGGGIPICPPAVLDDGKIDLVVIDYPNRLKIPYYLILLMKGKILTRKFAHRVQCESVRISPVKKGNAQYDGELLPVDALEVRVVSGKLKMYRS